MYTLNTFLIGTSIKRRVDLPCKHIPGKLLRQTKFSSFMLKHPVARENAVIGDQQFLYHPKLLFLSTQQAKKTKVCLIQISL
jgi:hypothetical protein